MFGKSLGAPAKFGAPSRARPNSSSFEPALPDLDLPRRPAQAARTWLRRPPGRLGLSLSATAGGLDGAPAGRFEALALFRVTPQATAGVRPYAGAGAALLARQARSDGYLALVLGAESRPAAKRGWFLEVGVGGGVRAAAGIRLRRVR